MDRIALVTLLGKMVAEELGIDPDTATEVPEETEE